MRRIVMAGVLPVMLLLSASAVQAAEPLREGPFEFPVVFDDFFAGTGQSCGFPVVGSWDVVLFVTTFFHPSTGTPSRIVVDVDFEGTLSNPLTGRSIPDASHHDTVTDYFAPDGTFLREVEIESRDNRLLHMAFHLVINADGTFADNGRDILTFAASRVIDIAPLCAALS